MKKYFFVIYIGFFGPLKVQCQLTTNDVALSLRTTGAKIDLNRFPDVKGSPYLNDTWQNGIIVFDKVNKVSLKKVKFNCFQNQIEYEEEGKIYTPIKKYSEFTIQDVDEENHISKNRLFRNNFIGSDEFQTFFEVLFDGETKLLQKYTIRIEEYPEPLSLQKIKRFSKVPQLFVYISKNKKLIKIKKDKKSISSAFENKSDLIIKYISLKDLNLKNEEDIAKICAYYDNLN